MLGSVHYKWASLLSSWLLISCAYNDFPKFADCSKSNLSVNILSKQDPSICTAIDGKVILTASGGQSPYSYSLNESGFQSTSSFSFLGPGVYVAEVQDALNCQTSIQVNLNAPGSSLSASASVTPDSECLTNNGSITITASQGNAPYQYQFGNGTFGNQNFFSDLSSGTYVLTVKDANNCPSVIGVIVPHVSTGISYSHDIVPILQANCAISGCHDGSLGSSRDWRNYNNVKTNAQNIMIRTENRSMPAGGLTLTQDQIQLIACWVDDGANNN